MRRGRSRSIVGLVVVLVLSAGMAASSAGAATIYVKVGLSGDGSSWASAYGGLQDGLDDAVGGDEIWVAAGTYKPTWDYGLGIGNRGKHFRMINGVGIYGGFDGTETSLAQRDVENNVTILSGDIGTPGDDSDNCYHVFYHASGTNLDATAILDGFTISGGNAHAFLFHCDGGGMYNEGSSPTVRKCTFRGNSALHGGGMYNYFGSSPTVTSCTFSGNSGSYGGGMHNWYSNPTVMNCTFTDNCIYGMYNDDSSPTVTGCIFSGNLGNGMYNDDSSPTVTGCTFSGNDGGGMRNLYSSNPTVTGCTFSGNWAVSPGNGGGMCNDDESSPTVTNCVFTGNSAEESGGGMYNHDNSNPIVTGCIFSGNSAGECGGGICDGGSATVTNCTFSGNSAGYGGAMYNGWDNGPTVTNCILWGNTATSWGNEIHGGAIISYCDIACCLPGGLWNTSLGTDGGGNIDVDPLFVDAAGGDFRLQGTSACINAGDNSAPYLPPTDFEGDGRIIHGIVDIGADEVAGDVLISLNVTIEPFERACTVTLDPAGGMYPPGTEISITVEAEEGYVFDNWSGDLSGDDNPATITVASPNYVTAHFHFCYNSNIIYVDADATGSNNGSSWDDAFNDLQDGLASAGEGKQIWVAAGIYKPTVDVGASDSRYHSFQLINDVAIYGGFPDTGEASWEDRDPTTHLTILSGDLLGNDNPATPVEELLDESSRADNCYHVFCHPSGTNLDATAVLDGFTIVAGNANGPGDHNNGGGMYNYGSNPTVTGCIFTDNAVYRDGGGMYNYEYSNPTVTDCTFSGNSAFLDGGGMFNRESSPTVSNCILWGNTAASEGNEIYNDSGTAVISYCDIAGCGSSGAGWDDDLGTDGGGNIDSDPLFVDADGADDTPGTEDDNLRLQAASPCIDAGDNSVVTEATDLDGNARVVDGDCDSVAVVDMGAYEFGWVYLGDFDGQCDVDLVDFAIMSAAWLSDDTPSTNWNQDCDLDDSGVIDMGDLEILGTNWLTGE